MKKPIVLSIAGFDPCGGAGILADIKTFENTGVYGMAVITALTLQTEKIFQSLEFRPTSTIQNEIRFLFEHYPIKAVKIGIIQNLNLLENILSVIPTQDTIIIWDPVLKSSTNHLIFNEDNLATLNNLLSHITCITPNVHEALFLSRKSNIEEAGLYLSEKTNVIIKGGHNENQRGIDYLYLKNQHKSIQIPPQLNQTLYPKHGSGCVFSSALTAYLAKAYSLEEACKLAKIYTETFLSSNKELLGYHHA